MPRALLALLVLALPLLAAAAPLAPAADLDPTLPTPDALLGYPLGSRPAAPADLVAAFEALAAASPRVALFQYGASYEGRPLVCAAVGAPELVSDLDALRARRAALAGGDEGGADTPLAIWIGACVHGNETSGSDAALGLLHHLAADRSEATARILERCVVLIDPLLNPDGRARFLANWWTWGSAEQPVDDQDLGLREGWPTARGNHYLLDLNRDWYALSQRETRSRVALFLDWHPELSFDLHEMGSQDTYLFSPPRGPFNPHQPATVRGWWDALSARIAADFGARGWSCYSGDWNEEFNPNRGAAWPLHLGTIAYLGEQASAEGRSVRRSDGLLLDHAQATERQFTAALALIAGGAENAHGIRRDFLAARRDWPGRDAAGRVLYLIDGGRRPALARRLAVQLSEQGIRVERSLAAFRLDAARSLWGEARGREPFPAGSYLVDLDQDEGRLAAALLDFDPVLGDSFLTRERRLRESGRDGQMYETSAWSLAMASGAEVYGAERRVRVETAVFAAGEAPAGVVTAPAATYGFLLDPFDQGADRALAACLVAGLGAHGADAPFAAAGHDYAAGAVLLRREGNPDDLPARLQAIAARTGCSFVGVDDAFVDAGEDLGSRHLKPLRAPRIALLAGSPFYQTTFGALWHYLDRELGLAVTRIRLSQLGGADLDRYDLILVPDAGWGRGAGLRARLGTGWTRLRDWVARGGTLVTCGEGAGLLLGDYDAPLLDPDEGPLGSLRARRQVLGELPGYLEAAARETGAADLVVDELALRRGDAEAIRRPQAGDSTGFVSAESDAWQRRFAPGGCILRVDLDGRHWLSAGVGDRVAVMVRSDLALLARRPAETVGRFAAAAELRLSGLLWPEARERWADSAYLVRERIGEGQAVSFLGNPVFRRSFHGSGRLLANALLLGPGMGTRDRSSY